MSLTKELNNPLSPVSKWFASKLAASNATFELSSTLHADCQMVIDGTIVDIRTSTKRQPFTLNNFYQQIAYTLYDTEDAYKINQLVWVYTRQQVTFSYKIDQLFKNLEATRADFKKMLITVGACNYKSLGLQTRAIFGSN